MGNYKPIYRLPEDFGAITEGPKKVKIVYKAEKSRVKRLPPTTHDYIMFKEMSGNEILLNLENASDLRKGELVSALLELSHRSKREPHDWMVHPWVRGAVACVKDQIGGFRIKQVI